LPWPSPPLLCLHRRREFAVRKQGHREVIRVRSIPHECARADLLHGRQPTRWPRPVGARDVSLPLAKGSHATSRWAGFRLPLPDFLEACPTLPHSSQRRRVHFFAAAATIVPHMKASPCSARRDPGGTIMPGKPRVFVTRIIPEVGL